MSLLVIHVVADTVMTTLMEAVAVQVAVAKQYFNTIIREFAEKWLPFFVRARTALAHFLF